MSDPTWDLYQSLHAVLQAGSLSAASRSRGLTQPTIGRHIETLEQQLGAPLFLRSPRGLTPTDLAVSLKAHLEEMHAAASAAARDASGSADSEKGSIRIAASLIVGVEVLPQILAGFMEQHPDIAIELVLSNKIEDLSRRDADIAVRMARPTQGALVARKIGMLGVGFYATQGYIDRRGMPQSMEDLENHVLCGFDRERPPLEALTQIEFPRPITRDVFAFRTDNDAAQIAAVRAGMGIGGIQHQIARRDGLVPVLANAFSFELECWIAMHENLKGSRRMRLMFDHLGAGFAEYLGRK
ncbi:MAG: LysR family transcriptional regulator [Phenylobacterium sp.]|jgi:DNA-binding transcriptional LysR family regulator|uniref:LysR family transcriptional regulator n=1 Tax=Phenylobacterium sp. TaxID=1871053 RepID=UPI001B61887F|nr:LysR family transcriptional regulator [Phenylobacterium sp.]MBP7649863.1 LysR family transcriptional regulator [Phenylobacterium sp.]MBP7817801.1 LysR family transcriptional regulator [Phenylobacterium sp.]MBP9232423.1 LysR family transcriptional regulator [Phenylobacterium sp.]MBP9755867.1 LysR family transcriptional regulator [Phenylobacterium sp.]